MVYFYLVLVFQARVRELRNEQKAHNNVGKKEFFFFVFVCIIQYPLKHTLKLVCSRSETPEKIFVNPSNLILGFWITRLRIY